MMVWSILVSKGDDELVVYVGVLVLLFLVCWVKGYLYFEMVVGCLKFLIFVYVL